MSNIEVNFYQIENIIETPIAKTMAPLLLKILEEKKKTLIYSKEIALIKAIDNELWNFGRNKFIPHVTVFDQGFVALKQPIFITNEENNHNEADYLLLLDEASKDFVSKFSRIFYFYDLSKIQAAKKAATSYKPIATDFNCYKKDSASGKWVKFEL
jgi:DNA polymerase IIIc chi subunit